MLNDLIHILLFHGGYNTNLVLGTTLALGCVAGLVGCFILLRGQTLISDAVSHATLPGIATGFIVAFVLGIEGGRHLPSLMIGAALFGGLAALSVQWIVKNTRLNKDVAIGSVLGFFYSLGIVLLSIIQRFDGAHQAGLDSFLLGQVTGLSQHESLIIFQMSAITLIVTLCLSRNLKLLCFDQSFAQSIGKPIKTLDIALLLLMLSVVTTGLKTVGLILILSLLIIPPVTARFWANRLDPMLAISATIGAICSYIGAGLSALLTDIPTGGAIVLVCSTAFFLSMIFAPGRGIIAYYMKKTRAQKEVSS